MKEKVVQYVLQVAWPWIRETVLPFLKDHWAEIYDFLIKEFQRRASSAEAKQAERRQFEAEQSENEARTAANRAKSDEDRIRNEERAIIWRQIADERRADHLALQNEFVEIAKQMQSIAAERLADSNLNLDFKGEKAEVKIGDKTHLLEGPK